MFSRVIKLETRFMKTKEQIHDYLAEQFGFPAYYGRNLDALYDCLMEIGEETPVVFVGSIDDGTAYFAKTLQVFADAAEGNRFLKLRFVGAGEDSGADTWEDSGTDSWEASGTDSEEDSGEDSVSEEDFDESLPVE